MKHIQLSLSFSLPLKCSDLVKESSIGLALEPSQREKDRARWFEGKVLNLEKEIGRGRKKSSFIGMQLDRVEKERDVAGGNASKEE